MDDDLIEFTRSLRPLELAGGGAGQLSFFVAVFAVGAGHLTHEPDLRLRREEEGE